MSNGTVPVEQITKLADDIRLIQDFAENHNFDSSLLTAQVTPKTESNGKSKNLTVAVLVISVVSLIIAIAAIKFWNPPLSPNASSFVLVIGLICALVSAISAHLRFENIVVTVIVGVGLTLILLVGAGIFTPEQAFDKATDLAG